MKLRYVGTSFGVDGLTNGKTYHCLGVENGLLRIIDDSDEDYLYSIIPGPMWDSSIQGRWEIVEDDEKRTLDKLFQNLRIALEDELKTGEKRKTINILEDDR